MAGKPLNISLLWQWLIIWTIRTMWTETDLSEPPIRTGRRPEFRFMRAQIAKFAMLEAPTGASWGR